MWFSIQYEFFVDFLITTGTEKIRNLQLRKRRCNEHKLKY